MPDRVDDLIDIDLVPGTVLFLPRGCWHATMTLEASVHLDLAIRTPTWADVFAERIRHSLSRHARWRAPVIDVESDARRAELAALLERFSDDVSVIALDSRQVRAHRGGLLRTTLHTEPVRSRARQRHVMRSR